MQNEQYPMPAMTEQERQELIELCKTISLWREKYGDFANVMLPAVEAQKIAEIALAALTAPPVQALRPVELPQRLSPCASGYGYSLTANDNGEAYGCNQIIEAIRAAGYEVKE